MALGGPHANYIACTSPFVQAERLRINRARSFTRCYTLSVCIQFPLPSMPVHRSTQLIYPQSCLDAIATQLFAGRIPIRFQGIPCLHILPAAGRTWKILQPPPESPNTRSAARLNLSISMHSTQYSLLLSCWVFSIYFKLNTSLTACQRNSLYGINPLEITFAFSS